MRTSKKVLCLLLLAGVIIATAPSTLWGDSAVSTEGLLAALQDLGIFDPNASGTKLSGPLTIYYQRVDSPGACPSGSDHEVNMFFTLRLKKGGDLFAFAGEKETVAGDPLCYFADLVEQLEHIANFVRCTVVPAIFGGSCPATAPPAFLKSATDITQDGQPLASGVDDPFYMSMEVELAVKQ